MAQQSARSEYLPGFKIVCSIVGITYVVLGGSMLLRGAHRSMERFGIPEIVLSSPHFADFFHWVFVHMMVIGILIGMLGRWVQEGRFQQAISRVLFVVEAHYTYLDLRTSDSILGSGLYQGPASLVPPTIDVAVTLAFAYLGVRRLRPRESA